MTGTNLNKPKYSYSKPTFWTLIGRVANEPRLNLDRYKLKLNIDQ